MPPLNHLKEEAFASEKRTNLILHGFQAISLVGFWLMIKPMMWIGIAFWSVWMVGHICSWWLPYLLGWPKAFLENVGEDNKKTYHFLPEKSGRPVPDFVHCVLGALSVMVFVTSWMEVLR